MGVWMDSPMNREKVRLEWRGFLLLPCLCRSPYVRLGCMYVLLPIHIVGEFDKSICRMVIVKMVNPTRPPSRG